MKKQTIAPLIFVAGLNTFSAVCPSFDPKCKVALPKDDDVPTVRIIVHSHDLGQFIVANGTYTTTSVAGYLLGNYGTVREIDFDRNNQN